MTTLQQAHSQDACYLGDRGHWLIVLSMHRDSDVLEQSNFAAATEMLGGESDHVAIERSSHWAVGWVDYLIIDPSFADLVKTAEEIQDALENYPVLDEQDFSNREHDEYLESWDFRGRSDYAKELNKALHNTYRDGVSEDFTADEIDEAFEELTDTELDDFAHAAADHVSWHYLSEGSGVTINISGLVKSTDMDKLADKLIEIAWATLRKTEQRKLGACLGACQAEITQAIKLGFDRVSQFRQLMQGMI